MILSTVAHRLRPTTRKSLLSRLFNFAVERDILENSPCYRVKKPAPLSRKDRALSEDENQSLLERF